MAAETFPTILRAAVRRLKQRGHLEALRTPRRQRIEVHELLYEMALTLVCFVAGPASYTPRCSITCKSRDTVPRWH